MLDVRDPIRILVTNDDSVASDGLWHLAAALRGPGRLVTVAAPASDASGFAAAVGHIGPGAVIGVEPVPWPERWDAPDVPAWAVDGPPARCVLAAMLGVFGPKPHLVVSGINAGANTGRFLQLHSGTLGAALTAANSGRHGMAVSLDTVPHAPSAAGARWHTAARTASALVDQLLAQPARTVWNVNVPDCEPSEIAGIAEGHLGRSRRVMSVAPVGEGRFELRLDDADVPPAPADLPTRADRDLLDDGWVSITSVQPPAIVPVGPVRLDLG